MIMKYYFLLLSFGFLAFAFTQKTRTVGFYNVENLFDTLDGPNDDTEYLPSAKSEWNTAKYEEKLNHIRQVLLAMGKPIICGFSEVENRSVVQAIVSQQKAFKHYGVVHFDSPDARGIDVALIYDSVKLTLLASDRIRFVLPGEEKPSTRDILWAKFQYKKISFYVMVNHWPSRRGGTDESEVKRLAAARIATAFIDSLNVANRNHLMLHSKGASISQFAGATERIIFLGDLNDHPENNAPKMVAERLQPMITSESGPTKGTHYYNNEWGILDHIYVSNSLLEDPFGVKANSGVIHTFPFLMEEYKGVLQPKRTYAGSKYLGGFSDHLPVSIQVKMK